MNDGDGKTPGKFDKLLKCERCLRRLPTDSEIAELCNRRKRESAEQIKKSMEPLENKGLAFCVCPERLWQKKPHLVAAVLAAKYPKMNWESPSRKNRTASWIIERLAGNSKKKPLSAKERRTLYEFREKGNEILYHWRLAGANTPNTPLIVWLGNLVDNPLIKALGEQLHTPADLDKFMREVVQDPRILYELGWCELLGQLVYVDLTPYGYDPDGMKEKLYKEHPEYQCILEGVMEDYGYDECVFELQMYGFHPYLAEYEMCDDRYDDEAILDDTVDDNYRYDDDEPNCRAIVTSVNLLKMLNPKEPGCSASSQLCRTNSGQE